MALNTLKTSTNGEQSRQEQVLIHVINILDYVLQQLGDSGAVQARDDQGRLYDDEVATFHLCELLINLDPLRYRACIEQTLNFFVGSSPSLQNPFLISALIHAGHSDSQPVRDGLQALVKNGRLPNGLFSFYTAYFHGGDHFSTLWAVRMLQLAESAKFKAEIESALVKCCEDFTVFESNPSHLGFLLLNLKLNNPEMHREHIEKALTRLLSGQKNGLWGDSAITTAYVIEDLLPFSDRPDVKACIESGLDQLFDLKKKQVAGFPTIVLREKGRCIESLFLQTLCRVCLVGTLCLKKFDKLDSGLVSVQRIVGRFPKLYTRALAQDQIIKDLLRDGEEKEKQFKHLEDHVTAFVRQWPYERNVFVMMRYRDEIRFRAVESELRETFKKRGLKVHLAKDKQLVDDLWDNISIYMLACNYGVAVFEQAEQKDFNPNVSLELGFMLSRGKRVLLLKEETLSTLPTDVVGKLYRTFNIGKPETLRGAVDKWVSDVVITTTPRTKSAMKKPTRRKAAKR